ncbi:MAG TPA: hypothetical protein VGS41_07585, partial [Chthonomonadales bacterium]|nr:hypothetical protein [Chthonomonadales bacterium]
MAHLQTVNQVRQITTVMRPLVEEASQQPVAQETFDLIATTTSEQPQQVRATWVALQEADLMLESGGDPDAISSSRAAGVAQWMAGTGAGAGLSVNLAESNRLTRSIEMLEQSMAWMNYLAQPGADANAPGAPRITSQQAAAALAAQTARLATLRSERMKIDERFDPRKAIFAQNRYLLRLYSLLPGFDWLFQAYHGGVGGVKRTLRLYLSRGRSGAVAGAFGGRTEPSFEDVYFSSTPDSHEAAFGYIYSRSDDDRHYWWKLLASERVLAAYRRDPASFQAAWAQHLPGRLPEAAYYPDAATVPIADLAALKAATARGELSTVRSCADYSVTPEPLDPMNSGNYAALRPEAKGALTLIASLAHKFGCRPKPCTGDLTVTTQYDKLRQARQERRARKATSAMPPA